jgi:hypothetical protein
MTAPDLSEQERAFLADYQQGIISASHDGWRALDFRAGREYERKQTADVRAATIEECARVCEALRDALFVEHGYTEPDTNATGYVKEEHTIRDEAFEDCAVAIRALGGKR